MLVKFSSLSLFLFGFGSKISVRHAHSNFYHLLTIFATSLTGEGPCSGKSQQAGGPADDDVAVVDTIESDEEMDVDDDEG